MTDKFVQEQDHRPLEGRYRRIPCRVSFPVDSLMIDGLQAGCAANNREKEEPWEE
jgi:hypothetical protein